MPSYTHRFINSIVYNNTNGTNANRECNEGRYRSAEAKDKGDGSKSRTFRVERKRTCRISGECQQGYFNRRSIQDSKQFQVEGREDSQNTFASIRRRFYKEGQTKEALSLLSLFLFSNPNLIYILQAIDDICFQLNPTLFGVMINNI